jgi:nucleotide-binding universal stress UspA family protein
MSSNDTVHSDRPAEHDSSRADIVVGVDESPASAEALRWAFAHAKEGGTPLRLVHAWQLSAAATEAVALGACAYLEAAAADARARATQWILETLGGGAAEVRWTLEVHEGGAGQVLAAAAHGARLVVVGTHEHTGLRRAISGSVSPQAARQGLRRDGYRSAFLGRDPAGSFVPGARASRLWRSKVHRRTLVVSS